MVSCIFQPGNYIFMHKFQRTLENPVSCSGIGLHSGKKVNLKIHPTPANHGIKFIRTDLPDNPEVPALFNMVVDTSLATVIGSGGVIVSTIEHLMASLAGMSIDNARVELDAYEMPIMDGSAAQFTELIRSAGIQKLKDLRFYFVVHEPIELKGGGKSVVATPLKAQKLSCTIDYTHPLIQTQTFSIELSDESFEQLISRARTFGFKHEVEYMKQFGLARGGSLENAVVIDEEAVLNEEGLRYEDEFVRHKILDCIGDFSLLGMPILGHIITYKSGHAFNQAFLQTFFDQKESWSTLTLNDLEDPDRTLSKSLAI